MLRDTVRRYGKQCGEHVLTPRGVVCAGVVEAGPFFVQKS